MGFTLDDILCYDLRPNVTIGEQPGLSQWCAASTIIMFVFGLVHSCLTIFTFRAQKCREVDCGLYLLASSITSLLTVSTLTCKFWFVVLTQANPLINPTILRGGCVTLEFEGVGEDEARTTTLTLTHTLRRSEN